MPNRKMLLNPIAVAVLAAAAGVHAADFTWRGQLADGGAPAHGSYDLNVAIYADEASEAALAGAVQFDAVSVSNGEFAVTLPLDGEIDLDRIWLEVSVRDAGDPGEYETLALRQVVELAPAGVCPAAWTTTGNAGTGPGNFLGTTDATSLELRADNRAFFRATPVDDATFGDAPNLIFGSGANAVVGVGIPGATISGGGTPLKANQVGGDFASIGGGLGNTASGAGSRIGGGADNVAPGDLATVGGGFLNLVSGPLATVGGGQDNVSSGIKATIGGGDANGASGLSATVAGGRANRAQGSRSAIGGGSQNLGAGSYSVIPGGFGNVAGGNYSFAAGFQSVVRDPGQSGDSDGDEGTFVWSDAKPGVFSSTGPNQFLIKAEGGFALNSTPINSLVEMTIQANSASQYANLFLRQRGVNAGMLISAGEATGSANNAVLHIDQYAGAAQVRRLILADNGDLTVSAAAFKPGGGSWSASSDARLKKNVSGLDGALGRLLALQGVSFEYADPDPARRPEGRHIGFIAQQVQPLYPNWIGEDSEGYLTIGTQGFEALAVEALRELRDEKDREIAALRAENETLIAKLQTQLESFTAQQELLEARLDALGAPAESPEFGIASADQR